MNGKYMNVKYMNIKYINVSYMNFKYVIAKMNKWKVISLNEKRVKQIFD